MHRECWKNFPHHRLKRKPLVSYPGMHHGTYVTGIWQEAHGHAGITNLRWQGKCYRLSRRMRNPQFYISGKRPMSQGLLRRGMDYKNPFVLLNIWFQCFDTHIRLELGWKPSAKYILMYNWLVMYDITNHHRQPHLLCRGWSLIESPWMKWLF